MSEITISELSADTGFSISHLTHLVRRGILPEGRKEGKYRYLPAVESKLILSAHKPSEHWQKGRKRNGDKTPDTLTAPAYVLDWNALI